MRQIEFYVVVPQQVWLQRMILGIGNWREFDKGFATGELSLPIPSLKDMERGTLVPKHFISEIPANFRNFLGSCQPVYT
jgi:hypothetical protein